MRVGSSQLFGIVGIVIALAGSSGTAQMPPAQSRDRADLRHQIFVMEGALARAVEFGAQRLNRETRAVTPEMVVLAGIAHARGIYLEGYGVYFDVGVPILRQSMLWSIRTMLDQDQGGTRDSLTFLKGQAKAETNPALRRQFENAIAVLEARVSPFGMQGLGGSASPAVQTSGGQVGALVMEERVSPTAPPAPATAPPPTTPPPPPPVYSELGKLFLQDPYRAYTESVQQALMDAMVDYSAPMAIAPEEWLTVAARDNERRDTFAPPDPYEEVVTVVLRIRGADLAAYRTRAIDREEAKRRIQVREF